MSAFCSCARAPRTLRRCCCLYVSKITDVQRLMPSHTPRTMKDTKKTADTGLGTPLTCVATCPRLGRMTSGKFSVVRSTVIATAPSNALSKFPRSSTSSTSYAPWYSCTPSVDHATISTPIRRTVLCSFGSVFAAEETSRRVGRKCAITSRGRRHRVGRAKKIVPSRVPSKNETAANATHASTKSATAPNANTNRQCFARYRSKPSRARSAKAVSAKKPANASSAASVASLPRFLKPECRVVGSKNTKHRLSRRVVRNTSRYKNVLCAFAMERANRDSRRNVRCVEPSSASRTYSAARATRRRWSSAERVASSPASPLPAVVSGKERPPRGASSPYASRAASCDECDESSEPNPTPRFCAKKAPSAPPRLASPRWLMERKSDAPRSSGTPLEVVGRAEVTGVTYSSPCRTRRSRRSALHSSGVGEGGMPSPARRAVVFGGVRSLLPPPDALRPENRASGVDTSSASRRGSVRPSARSSVPAPAPAPSRDGARAERGIALDRASTTEGQW